MPDDAVKNPDKKTADAIVERAIAVVGSDIVLALPLGLGKAYYIANAFYRRAQRDASISLHIVTALSLELPRAGDDMSRRFLGPWLEAHYAGVPELDYAVDRRRGALPANVRVSEFFFNPGSQLGKPGAQQNYISSNYTHAVRDILDCGANVIAQMLAPGEAGTTFSLSCNPDLTLDLLDAAKARGRRVYTIGESNTQLPFLGNDAEVPASRFDDILDCGAAGYPLFSVPKKPVGLTDYAIALHVASLVEDGGTLQIGIGSLGDAIAHMIALRHRDSRSFSQLYAAMESPERAASRRGMPARTGSFEEGLYGCSEMLVEGLLYLREAGVLSREVDGIYCHGGFFLGSEHLYQRLRDLEPAERAGIGMTRISFINHLYGDESGKRARRRRARFVNSAMMVALTGEAVSDGLADHQVVSGVGGQYNFVAQAHELEDGRSILCLPSTRMQKGELRSNIVWEYPHTTIPRHLRDMVVTEYGIADLRGKSDRDVIVAMLSIADERFQQKLLRQAKKAGKVEDDFRLPAYFRHNRPELLEEVMCMPASAALLPHFPLDTNFSEDEARLAVALNHLKQRASGLPLAGLAWAGWRRQRRNAAGDGALLERMGLASPSGYREKLLQLALLGAIAGALPGGRPVKPKP